MLMGNGFQNGETLIIDDLYRRSSKSESYETYPQTRRRLPRKLDTEHVCVTTAEVEIVYRLHVHEEMDNHNFASVGCFK